MATPPPEFHFPPRKISTATLEVRKLRRDGQTQSRVGINVDFVQEYAALIAEGTTFPPVRAWFDGTDYWLADGFHRVAAVELAGCHVIPVEVHCGSLAEAQWDSYGANTTHGLRRNRADMEAIVERALAHPLGRGLSNSQISKHLGLPEATLRRWRKRLSSSPDEDKRIALRAGKHYPMSTSRIGKSSRSSRGTAKSHLRSDLVIMRTEASPDSARILLIIEKWISGAATPSECVGAIEKVLASDHGRRALATNGCHERPPI